MEKQFLTAKDVQKILNVKQAKSYQIIRELNHEMKKKGYMVIQGRVNKQFFEDRYFYKPNASKTG
ncbi:ICEBs1 excisionase [Bacillus paralicheniformis]|uniref:ICEBs1 excisionase n=1 Tax=Bacillus paralicheniformis TaxID=1648923 RepID=UPI002DBC73E9|nr:ICEBs1 excisionase [Bacillus paralicheniformis]MEC1053536.1 ICEBs1 excisionase [Bacillus paralicheniformis]MEC1088556.1 ICEBs1 excisionase [Bacillus paralicheniformis]MEC1104906.1 ICEBs1 excisionase [Bacillus paralicheniformis]MEC1112155.1 ICEBs1 excisionase [Bacillus paralicheniformis]MEC1141149.1 ICEBs1 excisionase [Bacillus paralicheniformis]